MPSVPLESLLATGLAQNSRAMVPGGWRHRPPQALPLHVGFPFPASLPTQEMAEAAAAALAEEGTAVLQYGGGRALQRLHEFLLRRSEPQGLLTQESAGLITTGSGQGLDLVCRVFLNPDDCIAVEAPTYMGAVLFLRNYVQEFIQFPLDSDGLQVDAAEAMLIERQRAGLRLPKLLYTIPTYQNPTGVTLSLERRRKLLDLASRFNFLIVEDDAYNGLGWGAPPPPALRALETENRVIYLTTLSKTICPGVRCGWAVAAPEIIRRMQQVKTDGMQPLAHSMVTAYLERADFDARIAWLRSEYQRRCEVMLQALAAEMPAGVTWSRPSGGFFIWLELPKQAVGLDTSRLAVECNEAGCATIPGESFFVDGSGRHALRLSFSFADLPEIAQGIHALASVIRRHLA